MLIAAQDDRAPESTAGLDAVYLGERFCVRRFFMHLDGYVEYARTASVPVSLLTPYYVLPRDLAPLVDALRPIAEHFAGLHIGDVGLARRLADRLPVTYVGALYNTSAVRALREKAGIARLSLWPPRLDFPRAWADMLPVETVVHGLLPLAATPRCLVRQHGQCGAPCTAEYRVAGGPEPLTLRGNTLYATQPIVAYGLLAGLEQTGLHTAVIESRGLPAGELQHLADIYRGRATPPHDEISGLFLPARGGTLDQQPWMRRRKAGG